MTVGRPMHFAGTVLAATALLLGGCPPAQQQQPTFVDTSGRGAPPGQPLRFGTVNARPPSADRGFQVIRTAAQWPGGPPPVSLDSAMLLVASAGMEQTGGYSLAVQRVVQAGGEVHVEVLHTAPGAGCPVPPSPEWVGQVVAMERVAMPVRFHVVQRQSPPCLDAPVAAIECWVEGADLRAGAVRVPTGTTVLCDGSLSRTDGGRGGPPVRGTWELLTVAEGSSLVPGPLEEGPRARVTTDVAGTYVVRLTVADAQGTTATADGTIVAGPVQQQAQVKVEWEAVAAGGEAPTRPMVLHVFRQRRDCSVVGRARPAWCQVEELPGGATAVRLSADQARGQFDIAVDFPEGNDPAQAVPVVTIEADGVLVTRWRDTEPRDPRARWEAGALTMPEGIAELTH